MENELSTKLKQAYNSFYKCIFALPDEIFLSEINGWTARDITAHLVGWNHIMKEASLGILQGQTPDYYKDAPNDYKNINAQSVSTFASTSKAELLAELKSSIETLIQHLESLSPEQMTKDYGARHHRGHPATVETIIESLAIDYQHHTLEIQTWYSSK